MLCLLQFDSLGANYTVTFNQFPTIPHENNIFAHTGNPPLSAFQCDISEVASLSSVTNPYCKIYDSSATNVQEYEQCSKRGICDQTTGLCTCFTGFSGINCQTNLATTSSYSTTTDVMLLYATNANFQGNVLHMKVRSDRKWGRSDRERRGVGGWQFLA